jgi:hypothetical protein
MLCKILKRRRVQFFEVLGFWKTMSNIYMELMWCVILFACSEDSLKIQWFSYLFTTFSIPCLYSKKCYWNDSNTGFCEWVRRLEKWCGQRKSSRFIGWSCFPYWSGEKQVISPFDCKLVNGQSLFLLVNCVYCQHHHVRLWPAPVLLPT